MRLTTMSLDNIYKCLFRQWKFHIRICGWINGGLLLTLGYTVCVSNLSMYGTTQIQLHSQVRASSKVLKGLLKITHNKLYECSRFSTLLGLVSKTHLSVCSLANPILSCALVDNALIPN